MTTPFEITDIRELTLSKRKETMMRDYVKKIYPPWVKNSYLGELYMESKNYNRNSNIKPLRWRIMRDTTHSIDTTPLLFSKETADEPMYTQGNHNLINTSHIKLRENENLWKMKGYDDILCKELAVDLVEDYHYLQDYLLILEIERRYWNFRANVYKNTH